MDIADPLSISSVNKHIIRTGAFLKWAAKRGYVVANYAEGLTITQRNRKEEEEREAYSKEDLLRFARSPSGSGFPCWGSTRARDSTSYASCTPMTSARRRGSPASTSTRRETRRQRQHPAGGWSLCIPS
jgi:hypothetical protein